jgi:hypothetical protein
MLTEQDLLMYYLYTAVLGFGFLRHSTSCMTYMDVGNADIAGANFYPCSRWVPSVIVWVELSV